MTAIKEGAGSDSLRALLAGRARCRGVARMIQTHRGLWCHPASHRSPMGIHAHTAAVVANAADNPGKGPGPGSFTRTLQADEERVLTATASGHGQKPRKRELPEAVRRIAGRRQEGIPTKSRDALAVPLPKLQDSVREPCTAFRGCSETAIWGERINRPPAPVSVRSLLHRDLEPTTSRACGAPARHRE